jgi:hypothetical protein
VWRKWRLSTTLLLRLLRFSELCGAFDRPLCDCPFTQTFREIVMRLPVKLSLQACVASLAIVTVSGGVGAQVVVVRAHVQPAPKNPCADPYAVCSAGTYVGRDPDPAVRAQMLWDFQSGLSND